MSHSVRNHLRLEIDSYDETIRQFIPGYEEGLTWAAREIAGIRPTLVLDLGAGTGALAEAMLEHEGVGVVEAIDVDAEMLDRARIRLKRFGVRARFQRCSFESPLPECDAVSACLALHHVPTMETQACTVQGHFPDASPCRGVRECRRDHERTPGEAGAVLPHMAGHLVSCGIDERRAYEHFDEWASEDTYFPLDDELTAMREAGFDAECAWREPPEYSSSRTQEIRCQVVWCFRHQVLVR